MMERRSIFTNKQKDDSNKDLNNKSLDYYLELTKDYLSEFPEFEIKKVDGFNVIDESISCPVGYKARAGEFLLQQLKDQGVKEICYVQPRKGFAGVSLSYLCKKYDMDLTLVMPSSKKVSPHQLLCIEYGAKPLFIRIAAMPNANRAAKIYGEKTGAYYVPLGLQHEYVIAGGVRHFYDFFKDREKPETMWSVISTGVLQRTMQIALPDTNFKAVAVSRNIQPGELGRAQFQSYHKPFLQKSDVIPDQFDCEDSYDSKGWHYLKEQGQPGDWFFSVAGNAPISSMDPNDIDSYRDWNDYKDFDLHDVDIRKK